ncbi:hypothetical protein ACLOJK_007822, partial [Asimina triloba]
MSVAEYETKFSALTHFAPNLVTDDEARIRRFQNGLDESIRDMVMAEQCEMYGKAVDRAMWVEKAVARFNKMFVKRKGGAVEGESSNHLQDKEPRAKGPRTRINEVARRNAIDATDAILDVATSNQGLVISVEKPDTDQRTAFVE